jgi:pimeloyl-ACP methyl ester carboxylesterase
MPHRFTPDGLCYETHGQDQARPVVFLNGTGQTTLYWQNAARQLRRRHRVVLYDARGQGQSALKNARLSIDDHADDLERLLEELSITGTDLVGLSHGAYLAAAFSARHAGRVGRLVLCGAGAAPSPSGRLILQRWRRSLETEGIEVMARRMLPDVFGPHFLNANAELHRGIARAIARRNDPEALAAHLRAVAAYRPLDRIVVPGPRCLVISGARDALVPPEEARRLADLYHGRHVCLPDVGHSVPVEAGPVFLTLVESFLSET